MNINASTTQNTQSEIPLVSNIQEFIFEIQSENIEEHINQLNRRFNLNDKHILRYFLSSFGIAFHTHPSMQKSLIELLLSISTTVKALFTPHELFYILCLDSSNYFLYELIENHILTFRSIFSIPHNEDTEFLSYFAPEFKTNDESRYNQIKDSLEFDLEQYNDLRSKGVNHTEIANIIREDDLDAFIEYLTRTSSDINDQIPDSIFEGCFYLKPKLTFIEYAAFHSSLQIFKHILTQNIQPPQRLASYAVMGGNLNIIHICEELHLNFDGAVDAVLIFHRNDVLDYFLENGYTFTSYSPLACVKGYNYSYFYKLFDNACDKNRLIDNTSETPLIYSNKHLYQEFAIFITSLLGVDFNRADEISFFYFFILFYSYQYLMEFQYIKIF